jgi:hypothetical protein
MSRLTFSEPFNGRKIWESERANDQKSIGAFKLKGAKQDFYMYNLDDFDQGYFAGRVTLRKNERLFRYETATTKIGGMMPLIKVNLKTGLVYFLRDLYADDCEFDTISQKPVWIDIHADFKLA